MTFTAEFRSNSRTLTVRLTVSPQILNSEWWPDVPERVVQREEREDLRNRYREWRDECLEQFATENNLAVQIVHRDARDDFFFSTKPTQ